MKPPETLDTVGLHCPVLIALTTERMQEFEVGPVLEVTSDDPDIRQDMPIWCRNTGNRFLRAQQNDGVYTVQVGKGNGRR